ncbi:hypothetical protein [Pseudomonas atacamensis]|uniref:hypothetical protein n=1 Tax=Pseudomonas atacamensis TaxID=2565368 RepID=UPI003CFAE9A7
MNFPTGSDADAYTIFGKACADFLQNNDAISSCYNGIRPIGIMLYQAIPYLLTDDPVSLTYITLLLNVICLLVLLASVLFLFRNLNNPTPAPRSKIDVVGEGTVLLFTLIMCIGYVPLRLSDIQSLSFFVASLSIISDQEYRERAVPLLIAGILAGISVLLKQNYIVSIFLVTVMWTVFRLRSQAENKLKPIILYLVGTSICMLQVLAVYYHSGIMWFYEPKLMEVYEYGNKQPYIELVAYTIPANGAYLTQLQQTVSTLEFIAIRFYEGLLKFYWAVYVGEAPFDVSPVTLTFTKVKLLYIQAIVALIIIATIATTFVKNKWLPLVAYVGIGTGLITAVMMHTENRYYILTRILCIVVASVIAVSWLKKFDRWRDS